MRIGLSGRNDSRFGPSGDKSECPQLFTVQCHFLHADLGL